MCVMAAYILAFIVETREYSFLTTPNRGRYTPWPGFAWITGTISGALWVVVGSAAFCAPPVCLCLARTESVGMCLLQVSGDGRACCALSAGHYLTFVPACISLMR